MTSVPPLEVTIAEISRDIKYIIKRLDEGDANFKELDKRIFTIEKEFEKRMSEYEKKFYAATVIASLVWGVVLLWIRQQLGG
jgi:dGTP triphosphohydrolase